MSRARILFAISGVAAMLWGAYSWAGIHHSYPAMQVEVTGFDGSYPVAVTVTNPTAGQSSAQVVTGVDGGTVAVSGKVSSQHVAMDQTTASSCAGAVWTTSADGGTITVTAHAWYHCTFDGTGAALCWNSTQPAACSQTSVSGASKEMQGTSRDISFPVATVYGVAQNGTMVMECCPYAAQAE